MTQIISSPKKTDIINIRDLDTSKTPFIVYFGNQSEQPFMLQFCKSSNNYEFFNMDSPLSGMTIFEDPRGIGAVILNAMDSHQEVHAFKTLLEAATFLAKKQEESKF